MVGIEFNKEFKEITLYLRKAPVSEDAAHSLSVLRASARGVAPIRRAAAVTQAQGLRIGLLAQFKLSVGRQQLIKVHQVLDEIKLEFGRLVLRIELEGLLKLMLCTFVFAGGTEDKTPHDPTFGIKWLFLDAFADFLDGFDDVALLELREGPVHVRVVARPVKLFGLSADIERLFVDHVDVEEEGQVVVGVRVLVVQQDAPFQVLDSVLIVTHLEVGQA